MDVEAQSKSSVSTKVFSIVLTYMLFSSTMLITNKAAIKFFPFPSTLLFLQLAASSAMVYALGQKKIFEGN
jgi:hypothetical protein